MRVAKTFRLGSLIDPNIVARVQPRASKGHHGPVIATLFLLLETQGVPIRTMALKADPGI